MMQKGRFLEPVVCRILDAEAGSQNRHVCPVARKTDYPKSPRSVGCWMLKQQEESACISCGGEMILRARRLQDVIYR